MRRMLAVAITLTGLTFVQGQSPSRIFTYPPIPPREALDRLNLELQWKQILPSEIQRDGIAFIQLLDNQLFVQLRDGSVHALDAETGVVQWSARPGERYPVNRRLGFDKDLVFFVDCNRIVALERTTGRQKWDMELPEVPLTPPMGGDLAMFIPYPSGRLVTYALPSGIDKLKDADKATQEKAKKFAEKLRAEVKQASRGGGIPGSFDSYSNLGRTTSSSGLANRYSSAIGSATAGRTEVKHYIEGKSESAIDRPVVISTQTPAFKVEYPANVSPYGVLISGHDRKIVFLRRDLENPLLRYTAAAPLTLPPVVFGPTAYLSTQGGVLESLDLVTGVTNWRFPASSAIASPPMVTNESIFVPTERSGVIRVDPKLGVATWTQPDAVRVLASNSKFVYATDRWGQLLILDQEFGQVLSTYNLSGFNVPFVNDKTDRLYFAANDGTIMCLRDQGQVAPLIHKPGAKAQSALPSSPKIDSANPPAGLTDRTNTDRPAPPAQEQPKDAPRPPADQPKTDPSKST